MKGLNWLLRHMPLYFKPEDRTTGAPGSPPPPLLLPNVVLNWGMCCTGSPDLLRHHLHCGGGHHGWCSAHFHDHRGPHHSGPGSRRGHHGMRTITQSQSPVRSTCPPLKIAKMQKLRGLDWCMPGCSILLAQSSLLQHCPSVPQSQSDNIPDFPCRSDPSTCQVRPPHVWYRQEPDLQYSMMQAFLKQYVHCCLWGVVAQDCSKCAEMAPAKLRGTLNVLFQLFITIGAPHLQS